MTKDIFYIDKNQMGSKESTAIHTSCLMNGAQIVYGDAAGYEDGMVPYGDVPFIQEILGQVVDSNYFPSFLTEQGAVQRYIEASNFPRKGFIKPIEYKRFTGYLWDGSEDTKPDGKNFIISEPVVFYNEWRYYVTQGNVVLSGWYCGDEINTPEPPELPWRIPNDWSGTIDIGETDIGLQVVECHHPFACGFYGKLNVQDCNLYCQWSKDGWEYMNKICGMD